MIKSYRDKETEKLAGGQRSKRLPADLQRRAKMRLERIDAAVSLDDLRTPPSHRLEPLQGDRNGQWSIRINDQWRICFAWRDGNAYHVEIVDYH
ncbi:MAG: type II toxin-antitoxin system RelE/ParE family toxin [Candidatus Competibacteraceae bacterium]|nr:type II toxin-antitoxin system RelE/ParE family toxin [Candidatus Competibacteraceae bacterium]